jgi:hypothetical protein
MTRLHQEHDLATDQDTTRTRPTSILLRVINKLSHVHSEIGTFVAVLNFLTDYCDGFEYQFVSFLLVQNLPGTPSS